MTWTCSACSRSFIRIGQNHYCGTTIATDFLNGKNQTMVDLFYALVDRFTEIGPIKLGATKTMIVIEDQTHKIAYILTIGKQFVDVVFAFNQPYSDNLCFRKVAQVPGSNQFNHHLRLMCIDDLNPEVFAFMKLAYGN